MRRRGAEEAKVVIQTSKKKNYRTRVTALSAFLSHDGWTTIVSLLLSFVC